MHISRRNVFRGAVVLGAGTVLPSTLAVPALAVAAPTIASCATWGARNPSSTLTQLANNPNKIIIHHTATANSTDYSLAHAYALSRSIQNYHMDSNGWSDTGQNLTVSRGGFITEGRHFSLSKLSAGSGFVTSAHCPGQNTVGVGIENEGTYTSLTPPQVLWDKLVDLCAVHLRPVQHRADPALRAPRLRRDRLSWQRFLRAAARAAHGGGRQARGRHPAGRPSSTTRPAVSPPRPTGERRPTPPSATVPTTVRHTGRGQRCRLLLG